MTEKAQTIPKEIIPKTPMRFIGFIIRPTLSWAVLAVLAVTLAQGLASITPYFFKKITDNALAGDADGILFWAILFPISEGVMYILWRTSGFIGSYFITKAEMRGHNHLFSFAIDHSDSYFANHFAGSLSAKLNRAVDHSETVIEAILWHYYPFLVQFLVTVFLTWTTSVRVASIFIVMVVILAVLNYFLVKLRRPHVVAYAESSSKLSGMTVDAMSNSRAVHQFSRKAFEVGEIQKQTMVRRMLDMKQWQLSEWVLVVNNTLIVATMGMMIITMALLWRDGAVTTGDLVMVLALLGSISGSLVFIGSMMNGFIRNYGEIEEGLTEILVPHEILDKDDAKALVVPNGKVVFQSVNFNYSKEDSQSVFRKLSFTIEPDQRVGLVGESGAGKTSLVALLLRQHNIQDGAILIDGQNIAEVTQDSLHENIAVVPQEPMLFHRTLMENIRYGKLDATDEEVYEAARMAHADTFIRETPQGYETLVGERGVKLSGGQRQRIAIARAILKNAPILILDEATSALDSESEVQIQNALHTLMEGKTVIAVAHRLSTLREMDRMIVLEKGSISQDAAPDVLRKEEGIYKRLWDHQSGGFLQE